jgi:hypothetical protein
MILPIFLGVLIRNRICKRSGRPGVGVCYLRIVFVLAVSTVNAQQLPEELIFQRHDEDEEHYEGEREPSTFYFTFDQILFDRSLTSINNMLYHEHFGNVSVQQGLWYELRRDRLRNMRHYLNASGAFEYSLENHQWITPGFDWAPVAQYSSDRAGRNALATLDIGPTAGFDVMGIPVHLRTGISGRRVDSLAADAFFKVGEYRSSVGAYGAFRIGSWDEPLPFAPIYFYADGIGRRIENSGMMSLSSHALGAFQFGERDSIFFHGGASLFNGREGYLEETADSRVALFTETPWRVERDVSVTLGYKAAQRSIFIPAVYYGISENALEFLNDNRRRDERTVRQTLSGTLSTDSAMGLYYRGTMSFEWRNHDKLFGKTMALIATPENIDSLEVNLWDHTAFDPRTTHQLALKLPLSLKARYGFSASRSLTEYPNFYINMRDTVTNNDDSDRRTLHHRISLEYKNDSTFKAEIFGELINYDLVFLKQAKSSSNRTDNTQRVGLLLEWAPLSNLLITEALSAEARKGSFHFPEFHQSALQRPRYSRAVNSILSAIWQATPFVGLSGEWSVKLSDYGFWYGREYMREQLAADSAIRTDFYAITSKSVYHVFDIAAQIRPRDIILEAGGTITSARDRHYESGNYIITNIDGHTVKPYVNAMLRLNNRAEIMAHLSHTFVIGNSALGYWDFRLRAECWF